MNDDLKKMSKNNLDPQTIKEILENGICKLPHQELLHDPASLALIKENIKEKNEALQDEYVKHIIKHLKFITNTETLKVKDESLSISDILPAFDKLEESAETVNIIIANTTLVDVLRKWRGTVPDFYPNKEIDERGMTGRIFSADVYPNDTIPDNTLIMASCIANCKDNTFSVTCSHNDVKETINGYVIKFNLC